MGSFETRDDDAEPELRPLRFAVRREEVFVEARNMAADLPRWTIVRVDESALVLHCERRAGFLAGPAQITVKVDGPDGIPSATVTVRSESSGLLARDRSYVREFIEPFRRRVG